MQRRQRFLVGQNNRGHWVVQDDQHRFGGVFISRADALRYVMRRRDYRPPMIELVNGSIELDMSEVGSTGLRKEV